MRQKLAVLSLVTLLAAAIGGKPAAAEIIYDNSERPLTAGTRMGPSTPDESSAQPIQLLGHDNIASVKINVARIGELEGALRIALWDDDGQGKPGQEVAELGTINADQLDEPAFPFASSVTFPAVEFNNPVTGLDSQATYYVVTDVSGLNVGTQSNGFPRSPAFGGLFDDMGTNNANELLVLLGGVWRKTGEIDGGAFGSRWLQMQVTSIPEPGTCVLTLIGMLTVGISLRRRKLA